MYLSPKNIGDIELINDIFKTDYSKSILELKLLQEKYKEKLLKIQLDIEKLRKMR